MGGRTTEGKTFSPVTVNCLHVLEEGSGLVSHDRKLMTKIFVRLLSLISFADTSRNQGLPRRTCFTIISIKFNLKLYIVQDHWGD